MEFMEQLKEIGELDWDWRAERLAKILLDESEDLISRSRGIVDLANWKDSRTLDALKRAAQDEELADIAGDEIGRSLGLLLDCEFAADLHIEDFSDFVRFGISQTRREATVPGQPGVC
ncbi:hypothetical protein DPM19_32655 [Actinomadura craniellae]|uniref:Uncharacterized protein n=1 Tax=Actinomadura craniellae TaxID=2231787 RepID=A0A365GW67_9ACTN|nr:hypothetical protein DPM19_32655 [Actinomadura craniellae]